MCLTVASLGRVGQHHHRWPRLESLLPNVSSSMQRTASHTIDTPLLGVLVLAAGSGSRMGGRPKCLLEIEGQSLLDRLMQSLQLLRPHEVVVVLGHHAQAIDEVCRQWPVRTIRHPDPYVDQVASFRLGLGSLPQTIHTVMVSLADQPLLGPSELLALMRAWQHRPAGIELLQPHVDGQPGHPVLMTARARAAILAAPAEMGCRQWQALHPTKTWAWPSSNSHYCLDLDTPQDLHHMEARFGLRVQWPPAWEPCGY